MATTLISATQPPRTKQIGNATIYLEPRLSANQLAQFVVAEPSKQETIVRDAKKVLAVRVANYVPGRNALPRCHRENGFDTEAVVAQATRMETMAFPDEFEARCNELSAAALRRFSSIASQIDCAGSRITPPPRGFDHLVIEGVRVSIQPEIVFSFAHRGGTKFGGVMFNFAKGESSSLEHGSGRYQAGDYAATLVFLMLGHHFGRNGGPRNANCFAVDIFRDRVFVASSAYKTMLKNVEAACRNVARQWDIADATDATDEESVF